MKTTSCFFLVLSLTLCLTAHSHGDEQVGSIETPASQSIKPPPQPQSASIESPAQQKQWTSTAKAPGQKHSTSTEIALIDKACSKASDKAFCQEVFNSNPHSQKSTLKQLVFIALQAAVHDATSFSQFLRQSQQAPEEDMDSSYENLLIECADSYESVVDLIADSTSALLSGPMDQVEVQMNAALGAIDTCSTYDVSGGMGKQQEVSMKNHKVKQLCQNALSVYQVLISGN